MENERRDEAFTMVLNRWHMLYRRGAHCAPAQCSIMGVRAHTVRPYGYASANDFGMGTRLTIAIILYFQFSIIHMVNKNAL